MYISNKSKVYNTLNRLVRILLILNIPLRLCPQCWPALMSLKSSPESSLKSQYCVRNGEMRGGAVRIRTMNIESELFQIEILSIFVFFKFVCSCC